MATDPWFVQLGRNNFFLASLTAWLVAQSLKVALGIFQEKRFNFKWFVNSGGMPSSHAALAACLATSLGMVYGFDSGLFSMGLGFAVITMFDAQGVRRQSGKQAEALNKIFEDIYSHRPVAEDRLKELFGHTPVEVFTGAILGIVIARCFF